jgi:type III secretory pathway component EscT
MPTIMLWSWNDIQFTAEVHKPQANKFCIVAPNTVFLGPQYGTCLASPFWHLEFWGGSLAPTFLKNVLTFNLMHKVIISMIYSKSLT